MVQKRAPKSAKAPPPLDLTLNTGYGLQISDAQYEKLAGLVYRQSGIHLGSGKKELLKARLAKRLRVLGCPGVSEYMRLLQADQDGHELVSFLDCITTNKTDFFREPQHFDFLTQEVLPQAAKLTPASEPLRLWSAACSSGEEPYTLAITLLAERRWWPGRGVHILASDLSTKVLNQAKQGVYAADRVATIPRPILSAYFQKGKNRWAGFVRLRPEVRELVEFQRKNLMEPFQFPRPFQVIFCRNVMIYFDKPTQEKLVDKFFQCLCPGGYLFVGHSESLTGINHRLEFIKPAVYRRRA
ncbi:MAG: protein-glutamate O-methyltransferase [Deltaproteobacteria bacterium]|nr:protein-glutamate O-methyltransferase [Deltaproteobacteria bacterium]